MCPPTVYVHTTCHPLDAALQNDPSASFGTLTTINLWPASGRRHQLRKHMAHALNMPILGENRYRGPKQVALEAEQGVLEGSGAVHAEGQKQQVQEAAQLQGGTPEAQAHADEHAAASTLSQGQAGSLQHQGQQQDDAMEGGDIEDGGDEDDDEDAGEGQGARKNVDVLSNGMVSPLCLCAAELHFSHPVTGEPLSMVIPEPAYYDEVRRADAPGVN